MHYKVYLILFLFCFITLCTKASVSIIPMPQKCIEKKGVFLINKETTICLSTDNEEMRNAVAIWNKRMSVASGFSLKVSSTPKSSNVIRCRIQKTFSNEEAYKISASPSIILIEAQTPKGIFYAFQTLRQLMPPAIESTQLVSENIRWEIPCVYIEDSPAFSYRGLMLDVARHFKSKEFVMRYIDIMAFHKMNTFHWHLTDDQGWRIEIKQYPKLTSIGGFRDKTLIGHGRARPFKWNMEPYGGFYTQEDIKEVVAYAQERFIEVIPEIEVPGHCTAALAAYPELSCTGGPFEVIGRWGVFNDIYCTQDSTFIFLQNVLDEVTTLFPSRYIHIGGDEAPKIRWKRCANCQSRIKKEGIPDETHLQSYFTNRIEQYLSNKGKRIIGWDEILEGEVTSKATIMSWRGEKGGIRAAKAGHDVIMAPNTHCYFDFYQAEKSTQPLAIGGLLTLEKVYNYHPIPQSLTSKEAKHIKGVQANLWSEYMPTESHTEYMTYPRAAALAEVAWTEKKNKNMESFYRRLLVIEKHYDIMGLSYYKKPDRNKQVEHLLSQMSLEEKIGMLHSNTMFSSGGVPRLGIPDLQYSDGPHGVRYEGVPNGWESAQWSNDACSYLPALTALANTWDRNLARLYGKVLGAECKARGKHISLAPGVNIHRSLLNGRNWEYFSEDPFLSGELAVPYIQGIQSQGIASCVKHFALNSQAYNQYKVSVEVDERTLHEIYLPAFEAAIQRGGAMSVMAAYNKVRGRWCTENPYLLDTLLRGTLGFDGMVVSDWNAVHNTEQTALCGMDVEMGTSVKENKKYAFHQYYLADPLLKKVQSGKIPEEAVNKKVRNILNLMSRLDLIGKVPYDTTGMAAKLAIPAHAQVARKIAEESFVLLKNSKDILPLNHTQYKKIAVIGANASETFAAGGGSTKLKAKYEITPLQGLKNFLGNKVEIEYAPGYKLNKKAYKVGHWFTNEFDKFNDDLYKEAITTAANAEIVIYVGGTSHEHGSDCEGYDKPNLKLPYQQDRLLEGLLKVNPNTVVVLMSGGPIELGEWYTNTPALLHCSFLGMEGGNALARTLFGEVNPSGKLTTTWCKHLEDMPDHVFGEYPGVNDTIHFKEGLMVGYRYFDTFHVTPLFEFGYGLSYTSFTYSGLSMQRVWKDSDTEFNVSFTITNSGKRYGQEIAQLYTHQTKCSVKRPVKELKGFEKVGLKPGESKQITIKLPRRALQYYDTVTKRWKDEPGTFTILIGASSRDIKLQQNFELKKQKSIY